MDSPLRDMTKAKDLKIETIKQMLEVANSENIATLLEDFSQFMRMSVEVKKALGDAVVYHEFLWTDDGQAKCRRINIEFVEGSK